MSFGPELWSCRRPRGTGFGLCVGQVCWQSLDGAVAIDRGTDDERWAIGDSAAARLGRSRTLGLVDIEVVDEDMLVALGRGTYANTPA